MIAHFFSQVGGEAAFALMVPILAGFIGYSIADKQGLAPAMIGGMVATIGGSGFLGGMIAGFVGGFAAKFIGKAMAKIPKSFQGLVSVLIVPLLSTLVVGAFMFFILNTPMSMLNEYLEAVLKGLTGINAALLGALLAGMMASDMGGPINKTASAFGLAMFAANIFEPSAALMVGGMACLELHLRQQSLRIALRFKKQKQEKQVMSWEQALLLKGQSLLPLLIH